MIAADVLIIGRGVAGYSMALALKRKGIKNIVIAGRDPVVDENITETLPLAAYNLLCRLNLQHLVDKHPVSTGIVSRWGGSQTLVRESVFEVFETSWQLNKAVFVNDCHEVVAGENIPCLTVTQLQEVKLEKDKWRLQLNNGATTHNITASFVVDASGRNSVFARKVGAKKIMFDNQVAVTGIFAPREGTTNSISSFIEALPDGWCYSAVNSKNSRFVTQFSDADILGDLMLNKRRPWLEYMRHSELFASLAPNEKIVDLSVCAASSYITDMPSTSQWLAIGDAAFAVDPLSSAGLFHALNSALVSADHLIDYFNGNDNAFHQLHQLSRSCFESYLQQRTGMYRQVTKFAHKKYWQRRQQRISLAPNQLVTAKVAAGPSSQFKKLNNYLRAAEWQSLYALCVEPTAAHDIVAKFSALRPAIPAGRTIQALQLLIASDLISRVSGNNSR